MSEWPNFDTAEKGQGKANGSENPMAPRALFWPELKTRPRPDYLIKGVFDTGCFGEIFGPTGCGKTFFATDQGLHLAAGWKWFGRRVKQAGVLYVSAEGGAAIINRLDAWRQRHNEELDSLAFAVVLDPTNLLDPGGVEQVIADASAVPDLGLIYIDTAARVMPGGDEGTESMGLFVSACDRIRAVTGAAVCVVHHTGKDASRGSRGSTVLPAAVDTAIEVSRDAATKNITANIIKSREGESGAALSFKLEVIELGTDSDGDPITSCVLAKTEPLAGDKGGNKLTANQATMFSILRSAMPGALTLEEWNDRTRDAGVGVKRKADLWDIRLALETKKLVHEYNGRWYAPK